MRNTTFKEYMVAIVVFTLFWVVIIGLIFSWVNNNTAENPNQIHYNTASGGGGLDGGP